MFRFFSFLLFLSTILVSCQKEVEAPEDFNTENDYYPDKVYDTLTGLVNEVEVFQFNYDDQKRLTSINDYISPDPTQKYMDFLYYYTGSETLPYKKASYEYVSSPFSSYDTIKTISYYYYDLNKRLIKDSVNDYLDSELQGYTVHNYFYTPGKVVSHQTQYFVNSNPQLTTGTDTAFLNSNGDPIKLVSYKDNPAPNSLYSVLNISYYNEESPFKKLSFPKEAEYFTGSYGIWNFTPTSRFFQKQEYTDYFSPSGGGSPVLDDYYTFENNELKISNNGISGFHFIWKEDNIPFLDIKSGITYKQL